MIMPRGEALLLPANPWFIVSSLVLGLLANMLQNMGLWGNAAWMPDLLSLVLVFWCVHQPRRVSIGVCFFMGLVTDVHQAALLGQHALSFSVMGFLALQMHRRMQWFAGSAQAPQVLPVFVLGTVLELLVRYLAGRDLPEWQVIFSPLLESVLWVPVSHMLLLPQRRAHDPDDNRPI
ncbi:MAG: rod shape-determining protein MreD [Alphaproteobacteria bacterium]|nr:rod shape-determining protein MreD [Alphaproteobacteria bacterium]